MTVLTPQVALSREFLEAYARLPKAVQKKVREFTEKFKRDPTNRSINYEALNVRDSKVRSVRIGDDYRAIVIQPPKGDVYLCVWVDHHDEAYRWAKNRMFEVNPSSGVLQVYDVDETAPDAGAKKPSGPESFERHLFDEVDDEDLIVAGVPRPLLASVRALYTEADLDGLAKHLPADAAELLYLLAAGYGLMAALEEMERSKSATKKPVDVDDFATALKQVESQQVFKVLQDDAELERMLDAPLDQWRIFLHPTQRRLVTRTANGPVRVLGGAGTGKTVVLMHRARLLATDVYSAPDDRILVTTFTKNLAADLRFNLRNLCGDEFRRIEVTHLHGWAYDFLKRCGHSVSTIDDRERLRLIDQATSELDELKLSADFYRDEWDLVVQPQEILDFDQYRIARRTGRGTRLDRSQRMQVWKVLARYRELLDASGQMEWPDVVREARLMLENKQTGFAYRAVLVDEVQDLSAGDLRLIRALVPPGPNDLFLVGDGHQRIYGQPLRLSSCGIDIRGRSRRLRLNYRTTQQIREHAVAILAGCSIDDLDGEEDTMRGYCSLRAGPKPRVETLASESAEAEAIVRQLKSWIATGPAEHICVAARTRRLVDDRYRPMLKAAGIETVMVEKDSEPDNARKGVRIATMHRLKGLEFPRLLLAGIQVGTMPLEFALKNASDEAERSAQELRERCLLYVASTRARDELVITGFGGASPLIRG